MTSRDFDRGSQETTAADRGSQGTTAAWQYRSPIQQQ